MPLARFAPLILVVLVTAGGFGAPVAAQAPGLSFDNGRWCQTIRECRFAKGGIYRGCISTYSCRRCRFVRANCSIPGAPRGSTCRRLVCDWSGV